ncbi:hypothetical protein H257_11215 [Aphanomyces astaci]|uniref:Uncharacterized protein n=1 Tax=Aphanomyces astaci TaxID=112090 RepID=W4G3M4_APHAT|nr:hypothetical protein H257_11215 [Aphanomyces astaci]ETV74290.1 hypothetical protein H257_11215 [Aphanomyces astaci]|eukprot:XP_009836396.1 hypothetical protein H257_11215 [Aphanomyces astaci]
MAICQGESFGMASQVQRQAIPAATASATPDFKADRQIKALCQLSNIVRSIGSFVVLSLLSLSNPSFQELFKPCSRPPVRLADARCHQYLPSKILGRRLEPLPQMC